MNDDPPIDLKVRTKKFALRVIRLCESIPKTEAGKVISRQLLRSGTSVGAHYREATRARSNAEFSSKIQGGLQELEESSYWMELFVESDLVQQNLLKDLQEEANELAAILVTCANKAKSKK